MTGRPGYRTMEMNGGSSAPYLACTPCVPLFVHCLIRVEAEGLLDYQGRAGIISIVRWNLRPVIFGVGIVPGLGGCQKFVYVFFFGSFLMGEKKHINKIPPKNPGQSRENFVYVFFFFMCFFTPQTGKGTFWQKLKGSFYRGSFSQRGGSSHWCHWGRGLGSGSGGWQGWFSFGK